jgi:hypothetical protein
MLIILLAIVIALVAWSLHLMQEAMEHQEFSLMLAGTLVAFSAAALVGVYFLMGNYIGYLTHMPHQASYELPYTEIQLVGLNQSGREIEIK